MTAIKNFLNKINNSGAKNIPLFTKWSVLQTVLACGALMVVILKLCVGLELVTNLNDEWPWGLWVAFDVGILIATAAAGFTLAAIVYIFQIEKFKPLVRPAILIGTLFYTIAAIGIAVDLGRSWLIIHPLWKWNHESIMFEVSWCVMCYLTVLYLEFSHNIFEKFRLKFAEKIHHAVFIPLVLAGICFSFLHQSSLGALFLVTPQQQPLWHDPESGYMFFISAIAIGLAVLTIFSVVTSKAWKMTLRMDILPKLGLMAAWVLLVYLAFRFFGLIHTGNISAFTFDEFGLMFFIEIGVGMALPMIMLFIPKIRKNTAGLVTASGLIVIGVAVNRFMTLIISHAGWRHAPYFPSGTELLFTLGLICGAMLVYRIAAKYLPLYKEHYDGIPGATQEDHPEVVYETK